MLDINFARTNSNIIILPFYQNKTERNAQVEISNNFSAKGLKVIAYDLFAQEIDAFPIRGEMTERMTARTIVMKVFISECILKHYKSSNLIFK